jgi:hypothetical protein
MKTLLLYSNYTSQMSYFDDWVDAFRHHSNYDAICINLFNNQEQDIHKRVNKLISDVNLIVLHHSMNGDTLKYLFPFVSALKNRKGKLVSFVGNEVNLPTFGMAPKIKMLKELETDIIATQLLQEAGEWLYQDCNKSKVISLPHALNPNKFKNTIDVKNRPIDIGTRSARYGVYIGDDDRNAIIQHFYKNNYGLSVDLGLDNSAQKRFNRDEWADFLNNCKATLSTEAGSFFLEHDDKTVNQIHKYLKNKSNKFLLPNETLGRKLYRAIVPQALRKIVVSLLKSHLIEVNNLDQDTDFQEIYDKFFAHKSKAPVYTKAISSRHFDAIGTHTLHIMYPGRYNDILVPGEHFFELKRDHSNIDQLKNLLTDEESIKKITEHTYNHVIMNHTHKNRLDQLLKAL